LRGRTEVRTVRPMREQSPYRASILPVPSDLARPLWSVMIPTYNCAGYLRETLASVLAQDPGFDQMQIEVIDDHSTKDDPERVVAELGQSRVAFYRQSRNVGHTENFATCLRRSKGKLIHLLHGDDCVGPGFYRAMHRPFAEHPEIGAAFCRHVFIDENSRRKEMSPMEQSESGILDNRLERLALEQRIMTPSIVVRREVYEAVGGFDSRLVCAEDWEMWVRIAARYPIWYEVEPFALYRMHSSSNTGRHIRTGEDISYSCKAIEMFKHYLPGGMAGRVSRKAKKTYALAALDTAYASHTRGDFVAVKAQVHAALGCSPSLAVIMKLLRLLARIHWLRSV
jgi:glycosyltransferase involved in cell wall biosynthesis